ncbi:unnamed protein product [Leptosia nina]|uniref:Secreted protein n=1 Tax=Leptosia nina TaxID=320188 RepID=A0AAV1K5E2_9NEOP
MHLYIVGASSLVTRALTPPGVDGGEGGACETTPPVCDTLVNETTFVMEHGAFSLKAFVPVSLRVTAAMFRSVYCLAR